MVVLELREKYPLGLLLSIAGLQKSTYSYDVKHLNYKNDKNKNDVELVKNIFFENKGRYGRDRIVIELKKRGHPMNHKKVHKIMIENNLHARPVKKAYSSYKGEIGKTCKNLLLRKDYDEEKKVFEYIRCLEAKRPYQILGTDVTQFQISEGKLYLSPIIDFFTREVLAYDISTSPNYAQVRRMLERLEKNHKQSLKGAIIHSDQGYQYQMKAYQERVKSLGMVQSMSRKGNSLDNSPTENFFGRLKTEMFYPKEYNFKSLKELKETIEEYIEYYNNERIVSRLQATPIEARNNSLI